MSDIDPHTLDLPTLAALAGEAASAHLLRRIREAGFDGVRAAHGYVLQALVTDRPTVGDLAERLGVTQQAVSKSVSELESLAIVRREPDESDSRIRRVALTDRGQALLTAARATRRELEARVAADVGDLESARNALVALLDVSGGRDAVRRRRARPVNGDV